MGYEFRNFLTISWFILQCKFYFYLQVKAMAEGRDRRPELGYKLAMELKNPDSVLSQRSTTNGYRSVE